ALAVAPGNDRGVAVLVLVGAVALARDLPDLLAGVPVQAEDPGAAAVDQLEVKAILVEQRRGVHAVPVDELAVALLGVEAPFLLAIEIEAHEIAVAGEEPDVLAVRRGRGRGAVALVVHVPGDGRAQVALPELLAGRADAQGDDPPTDGAGGRAP